MLYDDAMSPRRSMPGDSGTSSNSTASAMDGDCPEHTERFRGMDRAALDAAYDNTRHVGQEKRDRYVADWAKRSGRLRSQPGLHRDLRYGDGPRQRLDLFVSGNPGGPMLVYIHGGYWQANDKELYSFVAEGPVRAGFTVALLEYTLAPAAHMDDIVTEVRQGLRWLVAHAAEFGGTGDQVYVAGHSAGGQLAVMAMDEVGVVGTLAISAIYDLEPIRLGALNEQLGLDSAEARRNSPILRVPQTASPMIITVGREELPELIRQSEDFARAWQVAGLPGTYLPLSGHDHFSILDELARPEGCLLAELKRLAFAAEK